MVSTKLWVGINFSLGIIAVILILAFFGFKIPAMGKALYALDKNPAYCLASYQGQQRLADPDLCCSQMQMQLVKAEPFSQTFSINDQQIKVDKKYYTSKNTVQYFVNQKMYYYCRNNGFWV